MKTGIAVMTILACLVMTPTVFAIAPGQVDDFEDGTAMGWREGNSNPLVPVYVPDGGPAGSGDGYLENASDGGSGPGSSMTMWNADQWAGGYLAAGVERITFDAVNLGNEDFALAIALEGVNRSRYGTINPVLLPADGQWRPLSFGLTEAELGLISGTATLSSVLADVNRLRVVSPRGDPPDWRGARIAAILGVDNIKAFVPPPGTPGDADLDTDVDDDDLSLLLANWGQDATGDPDGGWGRGEFNGAAPIGDDDLSLLLANWNPGGGGSAVIPDPATLSLLAMAAPALLKRRRNA